MDAWKDRCTLFGAGMKESLSYSTKRIAKIRDWRLGLLHKILTFATGIYVLIYSILLDKQWASVGIIDSEIDFYALQPTKGTDNCDYMVAQFTNNPECQLKIRNASEFPFCRESDIPYAGIKKDCFTIYGGVDRLFRRLTENTYFLATHLRYIYQDEEKRLSCEYASLLNQPCTSKSRGWETEYLTSYNEPPLPLRVLGGYNANLDNYELIPQMRYNVVNMQIESKSIQEGRGFLASLNQAYCDRLEQATEEDRYKPGAKYLSNNPTAYFLMEKHKGDGLACLVNLNRSQSCMNLREEAKLSGKDLNEVMSSFQCLRDKLSIRSIFEAMGSDSISSIDTINPRWALADRVYNRTDTSKKTYRESGIEVELTLKISNENTISTTGSKHYFTMFPKAHVGSSYSVFKTQYMDVPGIPPKQPRSIHWESGIKFLINVESDRLLVFSLSQLLSALTAALVLLGTSTLIVDHISACLNRDLYLKGKFYVFHANASNSSDEDALLDQDGEENSTRKVVEEIWEDQDGEENSTRKVVEEILEDKAVSIEMQNPRNT